MVGMTMGSLRIGPSVAPPPYTAEWDWGFSAQGGDTPKSIDFGAVAIDDIIIVMGIYRGTGTNTPVVPLATGTATLSGPTSAAANQEADITGVSRSRARIDWWRVTAAGTLGFTTLSDQQAEVGARVRGVDPVTPFVSVVGGGSTVDGASAVNIVGNAHIAFLGGSGNDGQTTVFTSSNDLVVQTQPVIAIICGAARQHVFGLAALDIQPGLAGTMSIGTNGGHAGYVIELNLS